MGPTPPGRWRDHETGRHVACRILGWIYPNNTNQGVNHGHRQRDWQCHCPHLRRRLHAGTGPGRLPVLAGPVQRQRPVGDPEYDLLPVRRAGDLSGLHDEQPVRHHHLQQRVQQGPGCGGPGLLGELPRCRNQKPRGAGAGHDQRGSGHARGHQRPGRDRQSGGLCRRYGRAAVGQQRRSAGLGQRRRHGVPHGGHQRGDGHGDQRPGVDPAVAAGLPGRRRHALHERHFRRRCRDPGVGAHLCHPGREGAEFAARPGNHRRAGAGRPGGLRLDQQQFFRRGGPTDRHADQLGHLHRAHRRRGRHQRRLHAGRRRHHRHHRRQRAPRGDGRLHRPAGDPGAFRAA